MTVHPAFTRRALAFAAALSVLPAASSAADSASTFPSKPIRLIVSQSPGSVADIMARVLSKPLGKSLGQTIVVENRPGGSGAIAAQAVARAEADGYTVLVGSISTNGGLLSAIDKALPYDPLRDFAPITQINDAPLVLITSPDTQLATLGQVADKAKQQPGALTYASGGNASGSRFVVELLRLDGKLNMRHIPYRSPAEAVRAVVAKEATIGAPALPGAQALIAAGRLKALAVTGERRAPQLPDVPTTVELGFPSAVLYNWTGLFAPANTPPAIVEKLNAAARKALTDPEVIKVIEDSGASVVGQSSADFRKFVEAEVHKWHKAVQDTGI
ncbi:tripartite tricarboxylate transporter substrate binding protein [Burkholderia dolosa]|uniref:Bug family tripartite tricarboxylate transporter substrate binding protein n=1 Tax=Burkholderia dolosa TaxID=152500 RepID=UPI001B9CFDF6|nr:tripartite tricarboxylate transporter substrate-binding protein [Burkholderia dolosa]MBR8457093.1 tripartite tricarboxylate transporter substrate binding protein [Burkholderia dolosa]MDN7419408.1 tripartite tricarboxylate transporter substrate-binding protein [Burkholderia dolosa]